MDANLDPMNLSQMTLNDFMFENYKLLPLPII